MLDFLYFRSHLLANKRLLIGVILTAIVASVCLATGLGGIAAFLHLILTEKQTLPDLMVRLNAGLPSWLPSGLRVPQGVIEQLPKGQFDAIVTLTIGLGVITAIGAVANYFSTFWALTAAGRALASLRQRLFGHVVRMPMKTINQRGPSAVVSQVVHDTTHVWNGYVNILNKTILQLFKGIGALFAALLISPWVALGAIAVGVILGPILRKLNTQIRRAARRGMEVQGDLFRSTSEAVNHLRVIKTSTAEGRAVERFTDITNQALAADLKVRSARSLASPLTEFIVLVVLGTLAVVTAKQILDGYIEPSNFITSIISLGVAGSCLKPLVSLYTDLQVASSASKRLRELVNSPKEEPLPGEAQGKKPSTTAQSSLARHTSSIELHKVTFTYPGGAGPAIRNVNLTIKHGQTIAFVGPNGCGKTTLLSLLPRLIDPDEGTILIDGVDISTVKLESLRAQIGVVTQETALFRGTIRWNIAFGVEHASEEQIKAAARKARATEFIEAKPEGYEFVIGEGGSGLSGGQRQRLAIARAILRDPAILILDEATSMVDADSEHHIAEALTEFVRGRTCLIVAHRLSTVRSADAIVVMNGGEIEDVGTHDELLSRSRTYQLLARTQLVPVG
jgi:ABC-type multidrug transport system fused ATPase/permease subunit